MHFDFMNFPCLYFCEKHLKRKDKIQLYSMLSAMLGLSPQEATQLSNQLAQTHELLFGGNGYSIEEITKYAGSSFEKPYRDCRSFYKRKKFSDCNLKDNCCVICPYSHYFLNSNLEQERLVLYALIQDRNLFSSIDCSISDFRSSLAISGTNDISTLPIIPFHAYLFEFLYNGGECTIDEITAYLKELSDCYLIPSNLLSAFVKKQLELINEEGNTEAPLIDSLADALRIIRSTTYTPPRISAKNSIEYNSEQKFERNSLEALETLSLSLSSPDIVQNPDAKSHNDEKNNKDTDKCNCAPPQTASGTTKIEYGRKPTKDLSELCKILHEMSLETADDNNIAPASSRNISNSNIETSKDILGESFSLGKEACELINTNTSLDLSCMPTQNNPSDDLLTLSTDSLKANNKPSYHTHPCSTCDYSETAHCKLSESLEQCRQTLSSSDNKQNNFLQLCNSTHAFLVDRHGCAYCSENKSDDCIYNKSPQALSEAFISIITDFTYKKNSFLFNHTFFSKATFYETPIAIECVKVHNHEGLLFYIDGSFYFIGESKTAPKILTQMFSEAKNSTFYSINPILVYRKLLAAGITSIRLESIAVNYSLCWETNQLFPPRVFMPVTTALDIYRCIMPQYERCFKQNELKKQNRTTYERMKELEWTLACSANTTVDIIGSSPYINGTNALNYSFPLLTSSDYTHNGNTYEITLAEDYALSSTETKRFWEDVAIAYASSLDNTNSSFLIYLDSSIRYFVSSENHTFLDGFLTTAQNIYKQNHGKCAQFCIS